MDAWIFVGAAVLGLIPAFIGKRKGYGFFGWWLAGFVFFILALPWAILIKPNPAVYRTCPHCQERISAKATACPRCTREVPPPTPEWTPITPTTDLRRKPPRSRDNAPYYVFAVVAVLLAFGVAAWAVL